MCRHTSCQELSSDVTSILGHRCVVEAPYHPLTALVRKRLAEAIVGSPSRELGVRAGSQHILDCLENGDLPSPLHRLSGELTDQFGLRDSRSAAKHLMMSLASEVVLEAA